jgi:hypothetical protein
MNSQDSSAAVMKLSLFIHNRVRRLAGTIQAAVVLLVVFLTGCATPRTISKGEFDRLTARQGMEHFYYIGSDATFHYFASSYFSERTRFHRYPKTDYQINSTFPKTKQESQWIPYVFDLNANTKGFRGDTQLTTNQNLILDEILAIAGLERQKFLDFVGGEAELAKLLNSDFVGEWHVEQVKKTLIASDFQKWAVVTIQSADALTNSTHFWQGVPIRSNDLPKDIFKIGPPVTGAVVRDGSNKPHVRIAWKSIESFWGLAAGDLDFQLKDEKLDIKKWAQGLFIWHDK